MAYITKTAIEVIEYVKSKGTLWALAKANPKD